MAAITSTPLVSVEEYIARFLERGEKPTCEYIDGELRAKPMATKEHSLVQANVLFGIRQNYGEQFAVPPELTTRLRETKFYVPDLVALTEVFRGI